MKNLLLLMILFSMTNSDLIFDFNKQSNLQNWRIVDDVVMGGRSSGNFNLNKDGHGVFKGNVSLENNGGFSSLRYNFDTKSVKGYTKIVLKVKGDGKDYQFRVKADNREYFTYISTFSTNGEWQDIVIDLNTMYPAFRGRKLNIPNFDASQIEQIAFLISNKKAESFELFIDKIELQ